MWAVGGLANAKAQPLNIHAYMVSDASTQVQQITRQSLGSVALPIAYVYKL